jgi:hypothetical protein
MRYGPGNVLAEDEIKALANKWWGNGVLPRHYFDALREAARLGAERAGHAAEEQEDDEEMTY